LEFLLKKNAHMVGSACATSFAYRGVMYYGMATPRTQGCNRIIHPDMLAEISAAIDDQDFDVITEENALINYIGNAVVFANTIYDLYQLIPERINEVLDHVNSNIFNRLENLSEDQIQKFKEDNRQGILAFKRLFLTRLLLS